MKTFDIIVLVFGYTFFWTLLIWFLIGILIGLFWYSLQFFEKRNKTNN
ncbi:hypothetical protein LEP1GSC062_2428 [Leptospira alexanderi serovar Manhao 3 str. L 60]|uniref:Uncharacterized protein n=1 Tax=Leptospira alexanderi serovar Manhao 3 str. L 60 TaxID=1049759 RepID=V6IFM6_9LEPT|nr:hypothetical protein LEP1GSC062_2428 [Leptospira alexanderi serovar Manhao 3 str. L 60]